MKQIAVKISLLLVAVALLGPLTMVAQKEEKEKDKEAKEVKEKKDMRQVIITSKNADKLVVEVNGDVVTVNGQPLDVYTKNNKDVSVSVNKWKDIEALTKITMDGWNTGNNNFKMFHEDENRAMLGVTTEKAEAGVKINSITKESAAAKIGLKEGDIISKINETKISDPDDLSAAIRKQKPGDKVTVTYTRDKKELTGTTELTKWKSNLLASTDFDMKSVMPRVTTPRTPYGVFSWSGGSPKLGLSVQDTDDGKGVKVLEVDEESNSAKAGLKQNDVITEIDGKAVNSTDEVVKIIRESKEKVSIMLKLTRDGKQQNVEVKMPRKIKTADL